VYYTLTQFAREKFISAGFPPEKLFVKSNSISPDLGPGEGRGGFAVFVGRLSAEKGVATLLDAWKRLDAPLGLKIIGEGPLAGSVAEAARHDPRIQWLGPKPLAEVLNVIGDAACLICPSVWYETFGRVIAEAYSRGTPVIASRLGAMAELIEEGETGLCFEPGDAADLAAAVARLYTSPASLPPMRAAARRAYEERFTPERNYQRLMELYELTLARCGSTNKRKCHAASISQAKLPLTPALSQGERE